MRRALLLLTLALGGCSGFSIGVRQDKADQATMAGVLARQPAGRAFPARALLPARRWSRLWVFRGGIATQAIEDRIGIPFPRSGEPTPKRRSYVVFDDGKQVVSSFTLALPRRLRARCLLTGRAPLAPSDTLVVTPGRPAAPPQLRARATAGACR